MNKLKAFKTYSSIIIRTRHLENDCTLTVLSGVCVHFSIENTELFTGGMYVHNISKYVPNTKRALCVALFNMNTYVERRSI